MVNLPEGTYTLTIFNSVEKNGIHIPVELLGELLLNNRKKEIRTRTQAGAITTIVEDRCAPIFRFTLKLPSKSAESLLQKIWPSISREYGAVEGLVVNTRRVSEPCKIVVHSLEDDERLDTTIEATSLTVRTASVDLKSGISEFLIEIYGNKA